MSKLSRNGQGSLEYLLLIAGAVLIGTVILIMVIMSSRQGETILNQKIIDYSALTNSNFSGGSATCGDGACNGNETCNTCSLDCGNCAGLPVVTIAVVDGQANENISLNDVGKLTITRTGSTAAALDVLIDPDLGTAANGTDFQQVPLLMTIPIGAATVDVDIVPLQDLLPEGVEDALITLNPSLSGTYLLSNQPNQISAFVQIVDDDVVPPETVALTIPDSDADEENALNDSGKFTITRSGSTPQQLALDLVVGIAMSGSSSNGVDYQTISNTATIVAGQTTVDVDVIPIQDNSDEGDESADLTIQPNVRYAIQAGSGNGSVTIHDNDSGGGPSLPTITISATDAIASEAGLNTGTFTVTRSTVDATVVNVSVVLSGTAGAGDYTTTPLPVAILANQASATIVITPTQDSAVEGSETVIATLQTNATYLVGSPASDTITIQDDDFNPPSADLCENYNSGSTNKPGSFPSYSSLLQQSWTWRRTLNPATDIDVGAAGQGYDSTSLVTSYANAACGSTIVVHSLPLATELDGFKLTNSNKPCENNPIHIYFVAPVTINGGGPGGDVINIDNVRGLVIDGMNNLKVTTPQGVNPRAIFFIGHQTTGAPAYTSTVKVVLKNIEVDGGYHGAGQDGAKWGVFGDGNTDIAFCNMYVHDIWKEHAFYFHTIGGNFEVVKSNLYNVGRTCIQIRDDWQGTPTSKYIYADNVCSSNCEGGALTADDTSGTWWIHGNTLAKVVQGFVSIDSQQQGYFDHRDGHVYFYDNKIRMGQQPNRTAWGYACNGLGSYFQTRDGGSSFYSQNNLFLISGGSQNVYFREYVSPSSTTHFPNILVESTNNTFANANYGTNPSNIAIARWDYLNSNQKYILKVNQWQQAIPSIYKNTAYDLPGQSTYIGDPTTIQGLVNQYFSAIP